MSFIEFIGGPTVAGIVFAAVLAVAVLVAVIARIKRNGRH